jgi:hypothetical protein
MPKGLKSAHLAQDAGNHVSHACQRGTQSARRVGWALRETHRLRVTVTGVTESYGDSALNYRATTFNLFTVN